MRRAIIGTGIGLPSGFATSFAFVNLFVPPWSRGWEAVIIVSALGAVIGSIIGGVGDILAYLRERFDNPPDKWPEADYKELPPFPRPGAR